MSAVAEALRPPRIRPVWRMANDGAVYCLRPLQMTDRANEKAFIASLSAESKYQRLMFTQRDASESFVDSMMNIDYDRTMAFVAIDASPIGESIIGVARYARTDKVEEIEFAIVVADRWQKCGIGVQLLRMLFDYARARNFRVANGVTFASNAGMVALAKRLGMSLKADVADYAMIDIAINLQTA